jgi:hypothetical protein
MKAISQNLVDHSRMDGRHRGDCGWRRFIATGRHGGNFHAG